MAAVNSFTGLASGLDTASIVKALVKIERQPIDRLQTNKTDLNSISTKFSNFKDLLTKLKDAAVGLKSRTDLLASAATSTDEKSVIATASGGATIGGFEVNVTTLATAQRNQSEAFGAKDQGNLFASGALTIQVGTGDPISINVDAETSLGSLVTDINRSGAGVTAAIIQSNGEFRLQISGNTTGAANAITFGGSAASTLGLDAHVVRNAQDAEFDIDGLPMTSATNTITEALPGVTLTLKAPTSTPTTIEVTRDNAAIKTKMQGFVDAYNAIAKQINTEFSYKGSAQTGATLSGDSSLRSVQARLRSLLGTQMEVKGSSMTSLSSLGLRTQQDGTLKIDDAVLDKALADSPEAVSQLLVDEIGGKKGIFGQFEDGLKDLISGDGSVLSARISSIAQRVKTIDAQMSSMETRMDAYETKLSLQFSQMEQAMSKLQNQGSQLTSMMSAFSSR